ncbi:MAG: peptidylprolyl isomerase [Bacteroidota bacterium]
MSVIQKIRDKYSRVAVIAIAVALLGFILIDYISGKSRGLFSSNGSGTVGSVNGTSIKINEFELKVKQQEDYLQQQYGQSGDALRSQAVEQAWNQEITRILMEKEVDKVGMQIGKKEVNDLLFGANPPEDLKRQFTDPQTGQYNVGEAVARINEMKRKGTAQQKESFNVYISQLEFLRLVDKYNALLINSINYPRWFFEKQNADNSQLAKISMVRDPYVSIIDSSLKVSNKEIEDYISDHKEDYKQEESRSIAYITFSAAPNAADSADTRNKLLALKPEFDSLKDVKPLLAQEGALGNYYAGYIGKNVIKIAAKDSIFKTPVGHVYGPYLDAGSYVLAKVEGARQMPDTVKIRHILVATTQIDPQTRQSTQVRDTAEAKRLIDSVQTLIRTGSNFDSVCLKVSDDGTKNKGGVYDNVPSGQMVPEFNDFIFGNPVGTKGIVKTEFGYHYIEILSQKGSTTGYKIAYLPRPIIASDETDKNAGNQANEFAGDSRTQAAFDTNYEKKIKPLGLIKNIATDITPTAAYIQGLGSSREFVKNIYKAKRGDVLQPDRIGDNYVVAVVTEVFKEGVKSVEKARIEVEPILLNQKKATFIKQKVGKITTLEAAATTLGKQIETVDSLRMSGSQASALGFEPRVNGAAFNPANKGKVVPEVIEGRSGVYVVRVDNVTATAVSNANVAEERKTKYEQTKQFANNPQSPYYPASILMKAATIKDNRADRY